MKQRDVEMGRETEEEKVNFLLLFPSQLSRSIYHNKVPKNVCSEQLTCTCQICTIYVFLLFPSWRDMIVVLKWNSVNWDFFFGQQSPHQATRLNEKLARFPTRPDYPSSTVPIAIA